MAAASDGSRTDVVFGVGPIRELLSAAPEAIQTLSIRASDQRRFAEEIRRATAAGAEVQIVDDAKLSRLVGKESRHQGMVAQVRRYRYLEVDQLVATSPDPLLIVDGVTDPRNLGAIMRSAEGGGVQSLIIAKDRTAAVTPTAIKTSAGAWIHLRIAQCGNVVRILEMLKERGYWIAALVPNGSESLYEFDCRRKLAIVVGAEDRGVREAVKKAVDFRVGIPMRGKVGSLNVAVATAVALFEIARRRGRPEPCQPAK